MEIEAHNHFKFNRPAFLFLLRCRIMAIMLGFDPGDLGSIPSTVSIF